MTLIIGISFCPISEPVVNSFNKNNEIRELIYSLIYNLLSVSQYIFLF